MSDGARSDDLNLENLREHMRRWAETWHQSVYLDQWLESQLWDELPYHDLRRDFDDGDRWIWLIPDFEIGRTTVIGVEGEILRSVSPTEIQEALARAQWKRRLKKEDLLLTRGNGELELRVWSPETDDAWFPDPRGGFFVTHIETPRSGQPGRPFLSLEGATWSAMGPRAPREPKSYTAEDLKSYLPKQ